MRDCRIGFFQPWLQNYGVSPIKFKHVTPNHLKYIQDHLVFLHLQIKVGAEGKTLAMTTIFELEKFLLVALKVRGHEAGCVVVGRWCEVNFVHGQYHAGNGENRSRNTKSKRHFSSKFSAE